MDNKYTHAEMLDDDALDQVSGGVASLGAAGSPYGRAIICKKCGGRVIQSAGSYYLSGIGTVCKSCYEEAEED